MSDLDDAVVDFASGLERFVTPAPITRTVGELRSDTNWPWGYSHGVYCFVIGEEVVYVGRALGTTLGQRLSNHLAATEDVDWARVVGDPDTIVRTYEFKDADAHLSAALEAYLISRLKPRFNLRLG